MFSQDRYSSIPSLPSWKDNTALDDTRKGYGNYAEARQTRNVFNHPELPAQARYRALTKYAGEDDTTEIDYQQRPQTVSSRTLNRRPVAVSANERAQFYLEPSTMVKSTRDPLSNSGFKSSESIRSGQMLKDTNARLPAKQLNEIRRGHDGAASSNTQMLLNMSDFNSPSDNSFAGSLNNFDPGSATMRTNPSTISAFNRQQIDFVDDYMLEDEVQVEDYTAGDGYGDESNEAGFSQRDNRQQNAMLVDVFRMFANNMKGNSGAAASSLKKRSNMVSNRATPRPMQPTAYTPMHFPSSAEEPRSMRRPSFTEADYYEAEMEPQPRLMRVAQRRAPVARAFHEGVGFADSFYQMDPSSSFGVGQQRPAFQRRAQPSYEAYEEYGDGDDFRVIPSPMMKQTIAARAREPIVRRRQAIAELRAFASPPRSNMKNLKASDQGYNFSKSQKVPGSFKFQGSNKVKTSIASASMKARKRQKSSNRTELHPEAARIVKMYGKPKGVEDWKIKDVRFKVHKDFSSISDAKNPVAVGDICLKIEQETYKAACLSWTIKPDIASNCDYITVSVCKMKEASADRFNSGWEVDESSRETRRVEKTDRRYDFDTELEPGIKYRYCVCAFDSEKSLLAEVVSEKLNVYTRDCDMKKLMELSTEFAARMPEGSHSIEHLYRNKPQSYWEDIRDNNNWLMEPYLKDFNGDIGSPIQGRLKGLFFGIKTDRKTSKPNAVSPFGNRRLHIPVAELLNTAVRYYFADFYCVNGSGIHYVTLVITKAGSAADRFCQKHLPTFDPMEYNRLFWYNPEDDRFYSIQSQRLWVEIFYTEAVDVDFNESKTSGQFFGEVTSVLRSSSTQFGLPKTPDCNDCCLDPTEPQILLCDEKGNKRPDGRGVITQEKWDKHWQLKRTSTVGSNPAFKNKKRKRDEIESYSISLSAKPDQKDMEVINEMEEEIENIEEITDCLNEVEEEAEEIFEEVVDTTVEEESTDVHHDESNVESTEFLDDAPTTDILGTYEEDVIEDFEDVEFDEDDCA